MIKTKRFILRPYRLSDAADVAKNINNPKISRNTATIPYPYTLKDAKNWLKIAVAENKKKNSRKLSWAIVIDGEVVGSIGGELHKDGHRMEIGYWLAEKHWGKGIITEAVKAFTQYLFQTKKLKRIQAGVYPYNPASMRVLEKSGFQKEGVLKKYHKKGDKLIDLHLFAKVK